MSDREHPSQERTGRSGAASQDSRRRYTNRTLRLAREARATRTETLTVTSDNPCSEQTSGEENTRETPTLRLRLVRRRRVQWTSDTHDNEHDGKKSSKSCCIFHKARAFDESSSESSEDASSDGNDGSGNESDGSSSSGGPSRPAHRQKRPNDPCECIEDCPS